MTASFRPFFWFWIGSIIFIWIDIFIGHLGGHLQNALMWIPLLVLPLAALSGTVIVAQGSQKLNGVFLKWSSWLLILTGLLGGYLHGYAVFEELHGSIQWEILVRMIRYPPVLAPLGVTGLGILGLILQSR